MPVLALIVFLPLLAALGLLAVPRRYRVVHRLVPLIATFVVAVLSVFVFQQFEPEGGGYQFVTVIPGLGAAGLGMQGHGLGPEPDARRRSGRQLPTAQHRREETQRFR